MLGLLNSDHQIVSDGFSNEEGEPYVYFQWGEPYVYFQRGEPYVYFQRASLAPGLLRDGLAVGQREKINQGNFQFSYCVGSHKQPDDLLPLVFAPAPVKFLFTTVKLKFSSVTG